MQSYRAGRGGGVGGKAAQNCHLSAASCPCGSGSLLTVILRPSLTLKISSFLFLVAEMDLDLHNLS